VLTADREHGIFCLRTVKRHGRRLFDERAYEADFGNQQRRAATIRLNVAERLAIDVEEVGRHAESSGYLAIA